MEDETLDGWLDKQIEYAKNAVGMQRSYKQPYDTELAVLNTLKTVREKMRELWAA